MFLIATELKYLWKELVLNRMLWLDFKSRMDSKIAFLESKLSVCLSKLGLIAFKIIFNSTQINSF